MNALEISNLKKVYKGGFNALKGVNLSVKQGDFFALLGPNGAGKTTLIGIITSLINKTSGMVEVLGYDLDKQREAAKAQIGLVPQEYNFSIFEKVQHIIVNQAGYYGLPRKLAYQRAEQYLKQLELWDKRNMQARTLSGGQKRRMMIARALVHQPKLLILDEPTAGVDIEIRRSMWRYLKQLNRSGITIILTTHYLEEAESLCKNIAIIDQGEIIEQTSMHELLSKLHAETFVLYLQQPIDNPPTLAGYECRLLDNKTLEVDVTAAQNMNELFHLLTQHNFSIASMRNKANRLEELFLNMVAENA